MNKWKNKLKYSEFEKNQNRVLPVFANINLLGKCNVDCYFCLGKDLNEEFGKFNSLNKHFKTWKNFDYFVHKVMEAKIKRVYVTGQNTDSLLYKYLDELIDYFQNKKINVGLRTNGYLAHKKIDIIQKCKRSVGYSIHSLNSNTNHVIMKRDDIPDWNTIIPNTPNCRVSIVLNRYNANEFYDLLKYISKFKNVKYIQVRRICTDTREDYLIKDVEVYEEIFKQIQKDHKQISTFYNAEVYRIYGKRVCFWRTVKTSIESYNYYTDGTFNDEYFVIEGYQRSSDNYDKIDGIPIAPKKPLEGYWRANEEITIRN